MTAIGYHLSSEEHGPGALVGFAKRAEDAGFSFALISDHYHPWTGKEGQSPFVWSVIGGVAHATERLELGTAVTCPLIRMHPAIVAQAAATAAAMMPGRFFLGVGTGENLNEHILGGHWPEPKVRREMLVEAVDVIRTLWKGGMHSYHGRHYTVEDACIYTLPKPPPPLLVAASTRRTAEIAGKIGDGLVGVEPEPKLIAAFQNGEPNHKPRYAQMHVCWASTPTKAREIVRERWPIAGIPGALERELRLPQHFEQAAGLVRAEDIPATIAMGADPDVHVEAIRRYADAGYDHVAVHQIGPEQDGFFDFYESEVLPRFGQVRPAGPPDA